MIFLFDMRLRSMRSSGFTIIELLVVIAIIGFLSAVILTGVSSARAKGRAAAAQQAMKSVHDIAMLCLSTSLTALCLPGQVNVPLGCTATPLGDTNNGGGGFLCSSNPTATYTALPNGWVYCNGTATAQGAADCGGDISSLPSGSFRIKAESPDDQLLIVCDESGCAAPVFDAD